MVSVTESKIPVINLEDLKPGTESWVMTSHKVRQTLEEYGCFMAVYGGSSHQELKKEVLDGLKTLFDLPKETKMKNVFTNPLQGYLGPGPSRPLYESMGIEQATDLASVQCFDNLIWPSGNDHFSKVLHSYANLISKLENVVTRMVFESYGVEKYYKSVNESKTNLLKLMKYTPAKEGQSNLAIVNHTDKNFLSILGQNQVNGMEVQIKDDEWVTVEYPPMSFYVSVADVFMAWSNGRLKSTLHRVVMNGIEDRYSVGFFSSKKGMMEIPKELVDEENPPRFKAFDPSKFAEFFAKDPIYRDERLIKLFCGV